MNSPASACRRRGRRARWSGRSPAPGARPSCRTASRRCSSRVCCGPKRRHARRCRSGRAGGWPPCATPASGVEVDAEHDGGRTTLRAAYAMGADGGSSPTRKALGYGYVGESGVVRDFMGGRMFAIHFRSPELYDVIPHPRAWMYWAVNRDRRAFMATVNGRDEFNFHTQLRPGQSAEQITDAQAKAMFEEALAAPLDIEIIARSAWTAGYTLVAEKFQRGRIFLGGDAVHLFTPAGGLGYNTAVEDAVNLGWKLARRAEGLGRRLRCSTPTRSSGRRLPGATPPTPAALPTRSGCSCRRRSWRTRVRRARRRASSPATTSTTTPASNSTFRASPSAAATTARRSSCRTARRRRPMRRTATSPRPAPGGRAPHLWLGDGRSLYDTLGFEFTLLALGAKPADAGAVPRRRRGAEHAARCRADPERRGARSLRRRSGADPARPDRGLARQFGGRRHRRAAPRGRAPD